MSTLQTASIEEIRQLATRLCRDYLTGCWKTINPADIIVKKVNGGLSNLLYYISLPMNDSNSQQIKQNSTVLQDSESCIKLNDDSSKFISHHNKTNNNNNGEQLTLSANESINEPNEVLLRIYGEAHGEEDALGGIITESVIFALLSERNFGPKLYGIFPGGRLEQFLNAHALMTQDMAIPKVSQKIAEKMAEIHTLNIPVTKKPEWLWSSMERWHLTSNTILARTDWTDKTPYVNEVRNFDFSKEITWLKSVIKRGNYKVVFCHNDMQEGNILYTNPYGDKINGASYCTDNAHRLSSTIAADVVDDEPNLRIIDFEYCAYNYRGFDLANHFIEWTLDYTNTESPYFHHYKHQYPTKKQRELFYAAYLRKINENVTNYTTTQNELDSLDAEVQILSMCSHLLWAVWCVVMTRATIEFGYWEYCVARIREYQLIKQNYQRANGDDKNA